MKKPAALLCAFLLLFHTSALAVQESRIGGITVLQLGTVYTTIRQDGNPITVPTRELTFAPDVPQEHMLAMINAPKGGRVTMRKGPSVRSAMMYTCYAGGIAAVLKEGKTYTRIHYQHVEGYVKTSSLRFLAPEDPDLVTAGLLCYKGKTTGKTTVNVRAIASRKSVIIATWNTGTPVTLLGHENGWYEVEARGQRGYVQEEYILPD